VADASTLHSLPEGVVLTTLGEALQGDVDEALQQFLQLELEKVGEMPFSALNLAFFTDGLWLSVPKNTELDKPVHLIFASSAQEQPQLTQVRNLVRAALSSQLSVVESYVGNEEAPYLTNTVTSVETGKNAFVDHYKLQEESAHGLHIGHIESFVERDAHFSNHVVHIGGKVVRNEVRSTFVDGSATCTLNGLSIAGQGQSVDNRNNIEHAKPHCDSFQTYKTILDGNGKGVFNGKIHVHPDAQKTDAKQNNQALLLSDNCSINSKPELEIYADDVKCTHGATSGYLDDEAMFYLQSRGISTKDAKGILTFAFANEVVDTFRNDELAEQLEEYLAHRFRKQ
jgi:Fe-S cluster assembly protein SufD